MFQLLRKLASMSICLSLSFLVFGFKLEKSAIELTQTEARKAPEPGEEKKLKEVPATPNFKTESFDHFMTEGPIQKKSKASNSKLKPKKR